MYSNRHSEHAATWGVAPRVHQSITQDPVRLRANSRNRENSRYVQESGCGRGLQFRRFMEISEYGNLNRILVFEVVRVAHKR
jgi:hypothetical protein